MGLLDFVLGMLTGMAKVSAKQENIQGDYRTCPSCGHRVKRNAIRCKYCNYYFKTYSKSSKSSYNSKQIRKEYSKTRRCPHCGKRINKKAIRCKYCKTIFKEY